MPRRGAISSTFHNGVGRVRGRTSPVSASTCGGILSAASSPNTTERQLAFSTRPMTVQGALRCVGVTFGDSAYGIVVAPSFPFYQPKLLLDCDEAARRSSSLFNQERQHDHLNSILLNLIAVDQALATSHRLLD